MSIENIQVLQTFRIWHNVYPTLHFYNFDYCPIPIIVHLLYIMHAQNISLRYRLVKISMITWRWKKSARVVAFGAGCELRAKLSEERCKFGGVRSDRVRGTTKLTRVQLHSGFDGVGEVRPVAFRVQWSWWESGGVRIRCSRRVSGGVRVR